MEKKVMTSVLTTKFMDFLEYINTRSISMYFIFCCIEKLYKKISDSLEDRMEHYAKRRKISTAPSNEETWYM